MTDHVLAAGEKNILSYRILLGCQLHPEGGSEIEHIGVTDVREERIGKTIRILLPETVEGGFPEKIDKMGQGAGRLFPQVMTFEMNQVKEFDMFFRWQEKV